MKKLSKEIILKFDEMIKKLTLIDSEIAEAQAFRIWLCKKLK